MMSTPNIILTGFMGSGKTTVGKLLAAKLRYQFVDTDALIESRHGMCIADIFRHQGEPAFRAMERAIARELAQRTGLVIATGGRMMLDPDNARVLSQNGRVFCLVATPQAILQRVRQDTAHPRPLLDSANPIERITELLAQRQTGYDQFAQLQTTGKRPAEITHDLIRAVAANLDLE